MFTIISIIIFYKLLTHPGATPEMTNALIMILFSGVIFDFIALSEYRSYIDKKEHHEYVMSQIEYKSYNDHFNKYLK